MNPPREAASRLHSLKRRAIVVCATAAMASHLSNGESEPSGSPATLFVTNCDDHGPGSLRDTLAVALSNDIVDLTHLSCSVITLTTGELSTDINNLNVRGANQTITADGSSRVISHNGVGILRLTGVTLADGAITASYARGGCLYSQGDVRLYEVTVTGCTVAGNLAAGGGVFAMGSARMIGSSITGNSIFPTQAPYYFGFGGGIVAGSELYMHLSTISGNSVVGQNVYNYGGGLVARWVFIEYSTISGNSAYRAAGAEFGSFTASRIVKSTFANNSSAAVVSNDALLELWESTIAWNGSGVVMDSFDVYLSARSSIIASNYGTGIGSDLDVWDAFGSAVIGSNNLIGTTNIALPPDTIRSDPLLATLADNGGPTKTIALMPGSPAIDMGEPRAGGFDQRYTGFSRVVGVAADIGAFEVQTPQSPPDGIFANGFD